MARHSIVGGGGVRQTPLLLLLPMPLAAPTEQVRLRLLALCRGAQDAEYLNLLARKKVYDRDRMGRLVGDSLKLTGTTEQRFTDDAGRVVFERLSCEDLYRLRASVAAALAG